MAHSQWPQDGKLNIALFVSPSASAQRQHWCGCFTDLRSAHCLLAGRLSSYAGSTGRTSDPNGPTQTGERGTRHYKPLLTNRDWTTGPYQMLICSLWAAEMWDKGTECWHAESILALYAAYLLQRLNAKSTRTVLIDFKSLFLNIFCMQNKYIISL